MRAKNSRSDVGHEGGFTYIIRAGGGVGESTDLLSLRLTTRRRCMLPISSGRLSSLLECRKSTVMFFQLPIWRRRVKGQAMKDRRVRVTVLFIISPFVSP